MALSSSRGASVGQGETLECPHCHRRYLGVCRLLTGGCFRCGRIDHFMVNCFKESRDSRILQGIGRKRYVAPPLTRDRGRGRGVPIQHRGCGGTVLETMDHPMPTTLAQAYAMKAREDQDAPEVIANIFSLYDIKMHALIGTSSTRSYVFIEHVFDKITSMERLLYDMHVTSPLG